MVKYLYFNIYLLRSMKTTKNNKYNLYIQELELKVVTRVPTCLILEFHQLLNIV